MGKIAIALAFVVAMSLTAGAQAQTSLTILTGAQGGVYNLLGDALSRIYTKAIPGMKITVQPTKTSAENLNALQAGKGELAFTLGDVLADAWRGNEEAGFKTPLTKLRGLSATYNNYVQIVARADSGIRTIADLKGKRVSVGVARSVSELNARAIVRAAGLSYKDFAKVEYLPFGQSMEMLKEKQIDATLLSAVAGVASLRDLAMALNIVIVAIPPEAVAKAGDVYQPAAIPANTYHGQTGAVPTAAIPNFLVTQADVSEDLAYQMTKAMYENIDVLYAANPAAKTIKRENAVKGMPLPLHPGAEKYYREVGVIR